MQQRTEDINNYLKSIFINKKMIAKLSILQFVPLHMHFVTSLCKSGHDTNPHTKNPCVCIATHFVKAEL